MDEFNPKCYLHMQIDENGPVFILEFENEEIAKQAEQRVKDDLAATAHDIVNRLLGVLEMVKFLLASELAVFLKILEKTEVKREGNRLEIRFPI